MKLSFSLLALLVSISASGQEDETPRDSVREKPIKEKIELTAIRVGTDLITLIRNGNADFSGWELNGDADIGRYYLDLDLGHLARAYNINKGSTYDNNGNYWRAGIDVNFLKKDPDRNMFFFGLRYGRSSFNENSTFVVNDATYGNFTKTMSNSSVRASWAEMVTGLRVKVWKEFWLGFTARMKFLPSVSGDQNFETYEIPGYGLFSQKLYWGFNYQIFYRFPLRKQKLPTETK